jgi:hypothetical protein
MNGCHFIGDALLMQDGDADERTFFPPSGRVFSMAKVIIPFYTVMEFVKRTGLINYISEFFKPFMGPASGHQ